MEHKESPSQSAEACMTEQGTPCQAGAIPSGCCLHSSSSPAPFSLTACSLLQKTQPSSFLQFLFCDSFPFQHPPFAQYTSNLSLLTQVLCHRQCSSAVLHHPQDATKGTDRAVLRCTPHLPAWQTGAGLCSTLHRQAQIRASHDLKSRKEINQTPSGQFGILQ